MPVKTQPFFGGGHSSSRHRCCHWQAAGALSDPKPLLRLAQIPVCRCGFHPCPMPVSNQRHPACKANMRCLEILRHNGFESAGEHAGKPWGNFQSDFTAFP